MTTTQFTYILQYYHVRNVQTYTDKTMSHFIFIMSPRLGVYDMLFKAEITKDGILLVCQLNVR